MKKTLIALALCAVLVCAFCCSFCAETELPANVKEVADSYFNALLEDFKDPWGETHVAASLYDPASKVGEVAELLRGCMQVEHKSADVNDGAVLTGFSQKFDRVEIKHEGDLWYYTCHVSYSYDRGADAGVGCAIDHTLVLRETADGVVITEDRTYWMNTIVGPVVDTRDRTDWEDWEIEEADEWDFEKGRKALSNSLAFLEEKKANAALDDSVKKVKATAASYFNALLEDFKDPWGETHVAASLYDPASKVGEVVGLLRDCMQIEYIMADVYFDATLDRFAQTINNEEVKQAGDLWQYTCRVSYSYDRGADAGVGCAIDHTLVLRETSDGAVITEDRTYWDNSVVGPVIDTYGAGSDAWNVEKGKQAVADTLSFLEDEKQSTLPQGAKNVLAAYFDARGRDFTESDAAFKEEWFDRSGIAYRAAVVRHTLAYADTLDNRAGKQVKAETGYEITSFERADDAVTVSVTENVKVTGGEITKYSIKHEITLTCGEPYEVNGAETRYRIASDTYTESFGDHAVDTRETDLPEKPAWNVEQAEREANDYLAAVQAKIEADKAAESHAAESSGAAEDPTPDAPESVLPLVIAGVAVVAIVAVAAICFRRKKAQ